MDDPICASCPNPSRQRTTITCGSCQRRWHALCVRVPAKKARELQVRGAVWHCRDCLGRGPPKKLSLTPEGPPPSGFAETLARLKRKGRIVSRLPKSVRPLVTPSPRLWTEPCRGAQLISGGNFWSSHITNCRPQPPTVAPQRRPASGDRSPARRWRSGPTREHPAVAVGGDG